MILRHLIIATATLAGTGTAAAQDTGAVRVAAEYVVDGIGIVDGGARRRAGILDNLELTLDAVPGWQGVRVHVDLLRNHGSRPNRFAASIQGIDSIEVDDAGTRLYEAWVKRQADIASVRVGLYDLNTEFYANDAADLFVASPFGMGSELSASGPNGPSTFPSTALTVRLRVAASGRYAQAAVINAWAGTIGDAQGIDITGRAGMLLIAEAGYAGRGKVAVGGWHYTKKQPAITPAFAGGARPAGSGTHVSHGVYAMAEYPVIGGSDRVAVTPFVRAGISDGATTPFLGGWQAGIRLDRVIADRPAAVFALGAARGILAGAYRRAAEADGTPLAQDETIIEATYSDVITPRISVQPDVQYVRRPGADRHVDDALVIGVRCRIRLGAADRVEDS